MLPDERRTEVATLVNERQGCSVEELAESLDVSEATIRRDLKQLADRNLVERTHGGAMPAVEHRRPYERRAVSNRAEKEAIADRAVAEILPDQIVFFDSGTTTLQVATALSEDREFVAATNGVVTAFELARNGPEVHLTGGTLSTDTSGAVGSWAAERIEQLNVDLLFLGTDGVDTKGLTNDNVQQGELKKRMIERSNRVVLVADSSKFEETYFFRFAEPADLDAVLTGGTVPERIREPYEREGVELVERLSGE